MRRTLLLCSVTALLLATAAGLALFASPHPARAPYADSKEVAQWRAEIRSKGALAAHAELLASTASSTDSAQHLEGHRFGRALFEEAGPTSFSVCGMELDGGCVHEFVGAYLAASGTPALRSLNESCIGRLGHTGAITCQHGFGHGLLAYYGYAERDLKTTLSVCDTIASADTTKGCYGGAFMEYDSRTMADNVLRESEPGKPFALCARLSERYRPACYFWSTQWLLELIGPSHDASAYAAVGAECATAPAPYRNECFRGLGYFAAPSTNYDPAETAKLCASVSPNEAYRLICRQEVTSSTGMKLN